MLCLIGFELYSRWVPLINTVNPIHPYVARNKLSFFFQTQLEGIIAPTKK